LYFNRPNEAVPLADYCLHELWRTGIVVQCLAYLADGAVNTLFGVHKHIFPPELSSYFILRDQLALLFHQQDQQLQGLLFQFDGTAGTAQFESGHI